MRFYCCCCLWNDAKVFVQLEFPWILIEGMTQGIWKRELLQGKSVKCSSVRTLREPFTCQLCVQLEVCCCWRSTGQKHHLKASLVGCSRLDVFKQEFVEKQIFFPVFPTFFNPNHFIEFQYGCWVLFFFFFLLKLQNVRLLLVSDVRFFFVNVHVGFHRTVKMSRCCNLSNISREF